VEWNVDRDDSASRLAANVEREVVTVVMRQSGARRPKSNAIAAKRRRRIAESHAIVSNDEAQLLAASCRLHVDRPRRLSCADAVAHGILDDRL